MGSSNGKRRPPRPRIELLSTAGSATEAAAIVAAVEQFLIDTAPPPAETLPARSPWQWAALTEGVGARQISGPAWGQAPRKR